MRPSMSASMSLPAEYLVMSVTSRSTGNLRSRRNSNENAPPGIIRAFHPRPFRLYWRHSTHNKQHLTSTNIYLRDIEPSMVFIQHTHIPQSLQSISVMTLTNQPSIHFYFSSDGFSLQGPIDLHIWIIYLVHQLLCVGSTYVQKGIFDYFVFNQRTNGTRCDCHKSTSPNSCYNSDYYQHFLLSINQNTMIFTVFNVINSNDSKQPSKQIILMHWNLC